MLSAALTTTDLAIYLAIYASVVSTAAGLWALFAGVFRDRARVTVKADEAYLVQTMRGQMIIKGEDTLKTMGVTQRRPILELYLRNRGRRPVRIDGVHQVSGSGGIVFADLTGQVPVDLPAETSKPLVLGSEGGYEHGSIRPRRFYAVDGAGRVHPLRERYRQRLAFVAYKWAVRAYFKRKRRRMRKEQQG
jgi:hypothetical protein